MIRSVSVSANAETETSFLLRGGGKKTPLRLHFPPESGIIVRNRGEQHGYGSGPRHRAGGMKNSYSKKVLFETMPVSRALATMAVPTIISQLIHLVYNIVDTFFIGRVGNPYMTAATTLCWTLVMLNTALSNIYGIGGGGLIARLMGAQRGEEARRVSAFTLWGAVGTALLYSLVLALTLRPLLTLLGASEDTLGYASQYTFFVLILGSVPALLSATLAHMIRNAGAAGKASIGLSGGGVLNILLDPLLMFVLLPKGYEVAGAALATLLSNVASCVYLLIVYCRISGLSVRISDALKTEPESRKKLFSVGIPSAVLTGLFDLANITVNMLASAHSDFVLAGMGIVMKVERIPTAVNLGICHGSIPIIAYNYASGNRERMKSVIRTARLWGLAVGFSAIVMFEILARPLTALFLSAKTGGGAAAVVAFAALFLRIRCLAGPGQFLNYQTSYSMQAMGKGRATILHAVVRELLVYIPLMIVLDRLFGETGLAAALPIAETLTGLFALWLLHRTMAAANKNE